MSKLFVGMMGFLLSFFLTAEASAMGKPPSQVEIGLKAPDFLYQKGDGAAISFADFRALAGSKITVVCFLSYDCPFSRMEMKSAAKFFEENKADVAAVGISPMPYESKELLSQYQKEQEIPFDLYWDQSGELTCLFHVWTVPEFFVYDREGVLRFRGGLGGMKNAVASLTKGESDFPAETDLLGCSVPKRQFKPSKKTVKKEIKKEDKKPVVPNTMAKEQPAPAPAAPTNQNNFGLKMPPSATQNDLSPKAVKFAHRWGK